MSETIKMNEGEVVKIKKIRRPIIYTEEFVTNELDDFLAKIRKDKTIVILGNLFEDKDYSIQRFSEWAEKFKDHDEISESIKKIKGILESRLNDGGLHNKLNPVMTIFNLKNNYDWTDKKEVKVSGNLEDNLTPEQRAKLNKLFND